MIRHNWRPRVWVKRYAPAEIAAIIGALTGGLMLHEAVNNPVATALGATWGENIAYYGYIVTTDVRGKRLHDLAKIARNIFIEFGPAEVTDTFFIRPTAMYMFPKLLNNVALGLVTGKLFADFIFYIPTIIAYELRKKYLKDD